MEKTPTQADLDRSMLEMKTSHTEGYVGVFSLALKPDPNPPDLSLFGDRTLCELQMEVAASMKD